MGDIRDPVSFKAEAAAADAVVHLAQHAGPERTSVDVSVLEALASALDRPGSPGMLIYTSVLFVLGNTGERCASEADTPQPPPFATERAMIERWVLDRSSPSLTTAVIRPGMVYGGGSGGAVSELFRSAHAEGAAEFVGDGTNRWSLVHRDDVALLFSLVLRERLAGLFHAVDALPLPVAQIASQVSHAAGQLGRVSELPLETARTVLGTFADALCLDQAVCAPRSGEVGWRPSRPSFDAAAAFAEWLAEDSFARALGEAR